MTLSLSHRAISGVARFTPQALKFAKTFGMRFEYLLKGGFMQDGAQENVVDIVELWRIVRSAEHQPVPPERLPLVERALKILARTVDPQMVVNHKEDLTVVYPHLVHLALDSEPSVVELPPTNFKNEDPLA